VNDTLTIIDRKNKTEKEISFKQYYQEQYGIKIRE
jgi:hypothetical protein